MPFAAAAANGAPNESLLPGATTIASTPCATSDSNNWIGTATSLSLSGALRITSAPVSAPALRAPCSAAAQKGDRALVRNPILSAAEAAGAKTHKTAAASTTQREGRESMGVVPLSVRGHPS